MNTKIPYGIENNKESTTRVNNINIDDQIFLKPQKPQKLSYFKCKTYFKTNLVLGFSKYLRFLHPVYNASRTKSKITRQ